MPEKPKDIAIDLENLIRLLPVITEIAQISKENRIPLKKLIGLIADFAEDLETLPAEYRNLDPRERATKLLNGLMQKIEHVKKLLDTEDDPSMEVLIQIDDFADFYYGTSELLEEAIRKDLGIPDDDEEDFPDEHDIDSDDDDIDDDIDDDYDSRYYGPIKPCYDDDCDYDDDDYNDDSGYDYDDGYIFELKVNLPDAECPYGFVCTGNTWDEAAMNLVNLLQLLTENFDL